MPGPFFVPRSHVRWMARGVEEGRLTRGRGDAEGDGEAGQMRRLRFLRRISRNNNHRPGNSAREAG